VPAAKAGGLGAEYTRSLRPGPAAIGVAFALGATAVVSGWWVGPLVAAAVVAALVMSSLAVAKLGGVTGDVLGAVEQVTECLVLVTLTALATRHPIWWR
ncbi:MAG: adenosylcobinamide-GDP ribazoletransferase, partial [Ilumatobacteraceae bacterium]